MTTTSGTHRLSPAELRAQLEDTIVADLYGPARGEHEEVVSAKVGRVRDRYLLGALAPTKTVAVDPERNDDPGVDGDVRAEGGDDSGSTAEPIAARPSMFPSSIGMSFVVEPTATAVHVHATWGRYVKEKRDPEPQTTEQGELPDSPGGAKARPGPTRVWQRYPMEGTQPITLKEGLFGPLSIVAEQPEVILSGRVSKNNGYWLVTVFLVNDQRDQDKNADAQWLFQTEFSVTATSGASEAEPLFVGRAEAVPSHGFADAHDAESEVALLDLQYRNHIEFAAGHGTAVHAVLHGEESGDTVDPSRSTRLETRSIPSYEVPLTEAPTTEEEPGLAAATFDMAVLAQTAQADLAAALTPLVDAYEHWIDRQEARVADPTARLSGHEDAVAIAITHARAAAGRLRAGIDVLTSDPDAAEAFRFANEAMWQQRIHSVLVAQRPADDDTFDIKAALTKIDVPGNRSWRPFQLAFVLLNIPSLADPAHPERSQSDGLVDLLFFPTGGGKTEAYLGLTAFTLAIRRLQGTVAGHDPEGLAVLMRYTLRLLTAQQFQRAAALICACEVLRRNRVTADARWGTTPFRLGMWVGGGLTPNRGKEAQAVIEDTREGRRARGSQPVQLTACPWCGRRIDPGTDASYDPDRWRTLVFCGDPLGACPFTEGASDREGLPVVTVDEELYRLLPALVISTADKWAQLPLKGPLHLLFGRVATRCERHGYRSPDLDTSADRKEADKHRKTSQLPAAETVVCNPLRPPDLIIQDELHLISGPLGTLVGLYETAVDELASWTVDDVVVRPKVVASTATVRRAAQQVHALFWRDLAVFPPPVLDVEDNFFARQRDTKVKPGRRYLGICARGQRVASVETRIFTTVLASAQKLYDEHGVAADPWMTMVGYFSALRELGGAKRLIDDDVKSRLRNTDLRGLGRRTGVVLKELTSRIGSAEIGTILDELNTVHDPATPDAWPVDVLLATNMISVGVDVARLGLMVTVGQPKATAEYIQATSRVGRSEHGPGLVFTIYNWARPRDLSHYETFEHYHATFYRHVEALSVTPFAARALDRGLTAVLVAMLRQNFGSVADWNPNGGAHKVTAAGHPLVARVTEIIASRAEEVTAKAETADLVRHAIQARLDDWAKQQHKAQSGGATLGYDEKATVVGLLEQPTLGDWPMWAVPNSLRETEPNVNLIIDERDWSLDSGGPWSLGSGKPSTPPPATTAEDSDPDDPDLLEAAEATS